jgi:hypothetical protein
MVTGMWWRALGVAAVLLCVGVVGGYAVADRDQEEPVTSDAPHPVPASPAIPTPPAPSYSPDPDDPPLSASGLITTTRKLRVSPNGLGVKVSVPADWNSTRPDDTNQWNFVPATGVGTYVLRVSIVRATNTSTGAAVIGRIGALEQAVSHGDMEDLDVTVQTDDTLEATYVAGGHLRLTTERWVSFDGTNAYASVAVTGREVDEAGMADLLSRTISSLRELPARQPG